MKVLLLTSPPTFCLSPEALSFVCFNAMRFLFRVDGAISATSIFLAATQFLRPLLQEANPMREGSARSSGSLHPPSSDDKAAFKEYPEDENSWVCRISKNKGACGKREYYGVRGEPQLDLYCPDDLCCSKTACVGGSCGSWCSGSWALCSSMAVYHSEYSYGKCSCQRFAATCDVNAECVHHNKEEGGVFCRCRQGYWGDGKTCKVDFCAMSPCGAGVCERLDEQYRCEGPENHKLVTIEGHQTCQERTDYCSTNPCGPEFMVKECKNTNDGYECTCMQGYEVLKNRCVEVDLCASSPCGPPEGVHSCLTQRQPKLLHRCQCKAGYDLRLLPDGETERCVRNWCYGEPCGPTDRVSSCHSSATGYSCLCKEGFVVSTNGEGKEVCVRQDICKQAPCGPANAVKECYSEGSSYRCRCYPGYAEVISDGVRKCSWGDPCRLQVCGPPEAVKECFTDGSSYSCTCSVGFTEILKEGQRTCVSEQECISQCGSEDAVKSCELLQHGEVKCTCNPGYVYKYQAGVGKCEKGNPCSVYPCGGHEAVKSCTPAGSSYTCECNEGFTRRILEGGNQVCANSSSCAGQPCGPPAIVDLCLSTDDGYTCTCKQGFVGRVVNGSLRCTPADGGDADIRDGDNEKVENDDSGISLTTSAGVAMCILLFVGAVELAVAYKKRRAAVERDGADDVDMDLHQPFFSPSTGVVGRYPAYTWTQSASTRPPLAASQVNAW